MLRAAAHSPCAFCPLNSADAPFRSSGCICRRRCEYSGRKAYRGRPSAAQGWCLQAALCSLLGFCSSCAYLVLMQRQVDAVSATDDVPIWEAEDNATGIARPFAISIAAYRAAFRPRLLVPISLAASIWACNHSGLHHVTRVEEGCLLLGFLSYKAPLALCLWDSLKPQYDPDASTRLARPVQYNVDEELNIDDIMDNIASVRNIGMRR